MRWTFTPRSHFRRLSRQRVSDEVHDARKEVKILTSFPGVFRSAMDQIRK